MVRLKGWLPSRAGRQAGFTYLLLLFVLALGGTGLAALGQRASLNVQRDKEAELRFRGQAIARAIASYWQATPGPVKQYPRTWNDLLEDRRSPVTQRHLRQAYVDPFTGLNDWVLIRAPRPAAPATPTSMATKPVGKGKTGKGASPLSADARQDLTPKDLEVDPTNDAIGWNASVGDAGFSAVRSRSTQVLMSVRDLPNPDPKKPARVSDLKFDAQSIRLIVAPSLAAAASPSSKSGNTLPAEVPE